MRRGMMVVMNDLVDRRFMSQASTPAQPRNIILAGFMGTGKTAVGRELARRLGWAFADADDLIEARAGKPIARVFAEDGEAAFRAVEAEVARDLAARERHVMATGGGMVVAEANRRTLEEAGTLVLLTATPETIWRRVGRCRHRPLLAVPDPQARIRELLAARREAYAKIPVQVATDDRSIGAIAEEILAKLGLAAKIKASARKTAKTRADNSTGRTSLR
jgi:shikimate kinase